MAVIDEDHIAELMKSGVLVEDLVDAPDEGPVIGGRLFNEGFGRTDEVNFFDLPPFDALDHAGLAGA